MGNRHQSRAGATGARPQTTSKSRRLFSRWSLLGFLVLSAGLIVFIVSNVIAVNKLIDDIDARRDDLEELERSNERLKAELVRLQSPDRVTKFARENLGMIQAPQAPNKLR